MRVLICGDRNWTNAKRIAEILTTLRSSFPSIHVIHGNARGADRIAGSIADSMRIPVTPYPADWAGKGRSAGPIRNRQMMDTKPDLVVAFHNDIEASKGTRDCVNEASRRRISVTIVTDHCVMTVGVGHTFG